MGFKEHTGYSVSLCMIVRDEEETVQRALVSVLPMVDEAVIFDTGSKDETPQIVRSCLEAYGVTGALHERPWPGSFSEARNWTLEAATGDFCLILDADEYVEDVAMLAAAFADKIGKRTAALDAEVVSVIGGGKMTDRFWQPRLIRNDPHIRYEGLIHNQIAGAIAKAVRTRRMVWTRAEGAMIVHMGYDLDMEARREKYAPRVPMYERAVREAGDFDTKNYYQYQLGVGLYLAGEIDRSLEVLATEPDMTRLRPEQEMHGLTIMMKGYLWQMNQGRRIDAEGALRRCLYLVERYPNPEALLLVSEILGRLGRRRTALRCMLMAYEACGTDAFRDLDRGHLRESIATVMERTGSARLAWKLRGATEDDAMVMLRALRKQLKAAAA